MVGQTQETNSAQSAEAHLAPAALQGDIKSPEDILAFWLDEVSEEQWYREDAALDARIRDQFLSTWEKAQSGAFSLWLTYPNGALAYIILMDQFPRNMFRGEGRAFASDKVAKAAAKAAIARNWDLRIDKPARQFFYLPLMHSECLTDQERCIGLFKERMQASESNLLHAKAHREVIRLFGRFPYRNVAMARPTTAVEQEFLDNGGYGGLVKSLSEQAVA